MAQKSCQIRRDGYYRTRGGTAHFLRIVCACCNTDILLYQKDGCGKLLRLYADRIAAPAELAEKQSRLKSKSDMEGLRCLSCGKLVAVPMVYEKEKRLAYRIIGGSLLKKKSA